MQKNIGKEQVRVQHLMQAASDLLDANKREHVNHPELTRQRRLHSQIPGVDPKAYTDFIPFTPLESGFVPGEKRLYDMYVLTDTMAGSTNWTKHSLLDPATRVPMWGGKKGGPTGKTPFKRHRGTITCTIILP